MAGSVLIGTSFSNLNNINFSDNDNALLESLLEESVGGDNAMLRNVMQSLEEEISDHNIIPETYEGSYVDNCPLLDLDLMETCLTSSDILDFSWTTDYMTNSLIERGAEEFVGFEDFSQPLEEMRYVSLWQESYQYTING